MTVAGATLVVFGFLALAGHTLQYRREPGAVAFLTSCLVCAGLALILASSVAGLSDPATALPVALAGWTLAAVAWAAFAFAYTGRGPTMTPRRTVGLLVAGGLGAIVMIAIEWLPVAADVAVLVIAPLSVVVLGLASFGCFLLARAGLLERDLATGQAGLVTVAGLGIVLLFLIGNLDTVFAPATIRGALLATLGVTAGALLVASLGFDLFASGPGAGYLARETVIDRMDACVILTDRDGQIIDCNRATEHTFGHERTTARGMAVSNLLGEQPAPGTHTLPTRRGHRDFDVTSSPLFTRAGEFVGYVLLLRDVTDRRTHEQRLAVLNRVLRHNLRNELDAIRAFAEAVPETGDPTTLATRIHDTAGGLADTAATVGRAERVLGRDESTPASVDIAALARDVADRYPHCTVQAPESLSIQSQQALLAAALEELVENAITHTDQDSPEVNITVETDEDGATITVSDRGPGIPDRERQILLAGEETPLRHGSGLGLWLVYWSVTRLGGTLRFREQTPRGSVVTMSIPDQVG